MASVFESPAWQLLQQRVRAPGFTVPDLGQLFDEDPDRLRHFTASACGLYLDFSRQHLTRDVWRHLLTAADESGLRSAIQALFDGDPVNRSEQQPALHMALRGHHPRHHPDIPGRVDEYLRTMQGFCEALHSGALRGATGRPVNAIVNLGIGGSDLGPALACEALWHHQRDDLHCHFVSNADPVHLSSTLRALDPETTLFIVASKSFRTAETLGNAQAARAWLSTHGIPDADLYRHFIATTARADRAGEFGIPAERILPMYDWTGGRFSLWSTIGLPVAMMVGMERFHALLEGAAAMDRHYRDARLADKLPLQLALLDIWNRLLHGGGSRAVLPYSQALRSLPSFLQQLEMESLGKSVHSDGRPVSGPTVQVLWGQQGTNGQHSFHQFLHQGTDTVAAEFLAVRRCHVPGGEAAHRELLANCLAQSRALMTGCSQEAVREAMRAEGLPEETASRLAPHRAVPGNRPSTTILLSDLEPESLGALLALYEHKVHALGVLWDVDAFDQWGVELGKSLGRSLRTALDTGTTPQGLDPASRELLRRFRAAPASGDG